MVDVTKRIKLSTRPNLGNAEISHTTILVQCGSGRTYPNAAMQTLKNNAATLLHSTGSTIGQFGTCAKHKMLMKVRFALSKPHTIPTYTPLKPLRALLALGCTFSSACPPSLGCTSGSSCVLPCILLRIPRRDNSCAMV